MEKFEKKIKLYFLGSGELAIPVLKNIWHSDKINLLGCATHEDKPAGRKKMLYPTPVGKWAEENNIPLKKVFSVHNKEFLEYLNSLSLDFILVVSFGQIIKKKLLSLPKFNLINIHPSLLPLYRGASPITASLLNGDSETGISIMEMTKKMDSGPIYQQFRYKIKHKEYATNLEDKLGDLAGEKIVSCLTDIVNGNIKKTPQEESRATYVNKINKNDGLIYWHEYSAEKIERMVRAYYPWPGAFFKFHTKKKTVIIKITQANIIASNKNQYPGKVLQADKDKWIIACKENALELQKVIPQGKKEMTGVEFLRGAKINSGDIING